MTRLPTLHCAKVIRALKRCGFIESEQRGSHLTLVNATTDRITTVPMHAKDIGRDLLRQILKQAGVTVEEFRKAL